VLLQTTALTSPAAWRVRLRLRLDFEPPRCVVGSGGGPAAGVLVLQSIWGFPYMVPKMVGL
jgi:hypothetical protein